MRRLFVTVLSGAASTLLESHGALRAHSLSPTETTGAAIRNEPVRPIEAADGVAGGTRPSSRREKRAGRMWSWPACASVRSAR